MIRLLADENLDADIVSGVLRRVPELVFERVQDIGLQQTPDPDILKWCAVNDYVLVTHDRNTVPGFAYERIGAGESMPGVFVVSNRMSLGSVIDELILLAMVAEASEVRDRVVYLPIH